MGRNKSPIRSTRVPAYWLTVACVALQLGWPAAPADSSTSTGEGSRATVSSPKPDEAARARMSETYGKLPLYFETNRGQTDSRVKFLSRGPRYALLLTSNDTVLVIAEPAQRKKAVLLNPKASLEERERATRTVLRMIFLGANPEPRVMGQEQLPGKANYFIGNDPARWRTNVPTYAKVYYHDLYPGIDLVFYGNQRQLEYDFVVRPGADPRSIALSFQGADKVEVDAQGDLVLQTAAGPIRQRKPVIYQEIYGVRKEISGGYVLRDRHQVGFRVAAYHRSRPLVIDPVLFYSTYLGGASGETGLDTTVDAGGNAYVTGETSSINFPTANPVQGVNGGGFDVFVGKLNATGSALLYATYLGGAGNDTGYGVAVDAAGNAYITGLTESPNFPITSGAFQSTFNATRCNTATCGDAFVAKLNGSGSIVYSTYLGGSAAEVGIGIAVDTAGNAYVTGYTFSPDDFPTANPIQATSGGGITDAFVTKLNPAGSTLVYSTYLGGSAEDYGYGIAVDANGNAYIGGHTRSADFPVVNSIQSHAGDLDAFVAKVNPTGTALLYSTLVGGTGDDRGLRIGINSLGEVHLTGFTNSSDFPTANPRQALNAGGYDAFVLKLNATGTALLYSTYLGGSADDFGNSIAVDQSGNAYVAGDTASPDFPITPNAFQTSLAGGSDAFVAKVNPFGTGLVYSTFLGGSGDDRGLGIALDALPNPNAYVMGSSGSTNFPTTSGAFQTTYGGGSSDAFVAKITDVVLPPGATTGKVTGGGSIDVSGGIGTFGFIVQRQAADASIHGDLQYVNHANGEKVHSVLFNSFVIAGNTATFGGACTNNGMPCTFTVKVTDKGEPGTNDHFTITVDAGPPEGDKLRSGSILIHR